MSNLQEVYALVLESAPAVHPDRRARIFRGLSDIIGDEKLAAELIAHAIACEELQANDRQLALDFIQRTRK